MILHNNGLTREKNPLRRGNLNTLLAMSKKRETSISETALKAIKAIEEMYKDGYRPRGEGWIFVSEYADAYQEKTGHPISTFKAREHLNALIKSGTWEKRYFGGSGSKLSYREIPKK